MRLLYKYKQKILVWQMQLMGQPQLYSKYRTLLNNFVHRIQRRKTSVNKSLKLGSSEFNQDIKLSENSQFLWVIWLLYSGFTVTHETIISVKNVESIGYLVDKILTKSGITLQNFRWKSLQVNLIKT